MDFLDLLRERLSGMLAERSGLDTQFEAILAKAADEQRSDLNEGEAAEIAAEEKRFTLDEVIHDEHMHERRALQWVDHPMYGRVCLPNSPMRYEGAAPLDLQPSGELGCDNEAVYCDWLGLSQDEFRQLQAGEVI